MLKSLDEVKLQMRVLEMKKMCVTLLLAVNPAETDVSGPNKGTRTSS
jgi:hypothetical protein